jgi:uncharacterized protein with HEPN domain
MPRDPKLYLEDIAEACVRVRDYARGLSFEQFEDDRKTADAVVRNLELIGEAARSLPEYVKNQAREVEWRKISGMRNILAHEYFAVNMTILWDIIQSKLGPLETTCRRLLAILPDHEAP